MEHLQETWLFLLSAAALLLTAGGCSPRCLPGSTLREGICVKDNVDPRPGTESGTTSGTGGVGTSITGATVVQGAISGDSAGHGGAAAAAASGAMPPPTTMATCGNGVIDPGEACDGNCPSECASATACLRTSLVGSAADCSAACMMQDVTACSTGDGCCPSGCTHGEDADCSESCGDGSVAGLETCEPSSSAMPCPTSCDDSDPCTMDLMSGSATQCNVACTHVAITAPRSGDTCCPPGANAVVDSDCSASCGNGIVEDAEICDGDCPASCDDGDPCTADKLTGNSAQCNAVCTNSPITAPRAGDGCCPPDATSLQDSDCEPLCGNNVTEDNETCDGDCPRSCDDRDECTTDQMRGSAASCTLQCTNTNITTPRTGDGCCPANATPETDRDCPGCGNGRVEAGEDCDGNCASACRAGNDPCVEASSDGCKCSTEMKGPSSSRDRCCPSNNGGSPDNDPDCADLCGNGVLDSTLGEFCDNSTSTKCGATMRACSGSCLPPVNLPPTKLCNYRSGCSVIDGDWTCQ